MILDYLSNIEPFKYLSSKNSIKLKGTCNNFNINLVAIDFLKNEKSIFVVTPNLFMAQKYYDELSNILNDEDVLFFPADELITATMIMEGGDFKYERINTILSLLEGKKKVVVTNVTGAARHLFPRALWNDSILHIKKGDTIDIHELLNKLREMGYKAEYTTRKTGEFSHRGSIVDIFPLNESNPVRLDFFGDELDDIKYFDINTQMSIEHIDSIIVPPVAELLYTDAMSEVATKGISDFILNNKLTEKSIERLDKARFDIENRNNLDMLTSYISFFGVKPETIFDYTDERKTYFIDKYKISLELERMDHDLAEYALNAGDEILRTIKYFMSKRELFSYSDVEIEGVVEADSDAERITALEVPSLRSNMKELVKELKPIYKIRTVIVPITNELRKKNLIEILRENGISCMEIRDPSNIRKGTINIVNDYSLSFNLSDYGIAIYSDKTIFEIKYEPRKIKFKSVYKNTYKISRYDELEIGNYVVHYDYGVGRYLGLKTMEMDGLKRDYIQIGYAKGDNVYVPLEQINLIQKYANPEDRVVRLTDLSSGSWKRAKIKVRNKVRDISDELIRLYSNRSVAEGFMYSPDSTEQLEFENDFIYETTPDQEKAIKDVKHDMESSHPMDRLVCGDVGYGKTEVALRAAMKAVLDGKQVAVLAPTTILSRQHYHTFKDRMERYGVHVELLNRFITAKKQKEIISKLQTGEVDVIIGTHRILSNELKYHDLGLLVVDEEQRFGVTHKEKIKQLKINVDTITLSATPIPRTLQMSIVGIRDLSMIETPPKNRYPIQTYVLERNDTVIRDAIVREVSRGGQVFYMYNRVEDIETVAAHVATLVPEARITIGHGKMKKEELEDTLVKFIDHEYDVMVCTTIIETGLDIPDTNTIIIHDSDKLGLSQAYQIRGRVGRSDRIAYAYLMFDPNKRLTPEAEKRLEALKEFSDLGSGFKIAMRDLAIRGAGDLLGSEQAGFIESVGLEMYMKILEEEIAAIKGEGEPDKKEEDISLSKVYTSRTISKSYIDNEDVRIEIHKKIDKIESIRDLNNLSVELTDRFGGYSSEIENYMYEKLFKNLCKRLDVCKVADDFKTITIYMSEDATSKADGQKLFMTLRDFNDKINLRLTNKMIQITFNKLGYKDSSYFKMFDEYLDKILY